MDPVRGDLDVSDRWRRDGDGAHYAGQRFRSTRARERDPRLVDQLLQRFGPSGPAQRTVLDVPWPPPGSRDEKFKFRVQNITPPGERKIVCDPVRRRVR